MLKISPVIITILELAGDTKLTIPYFVIVLVEHG